MSATCRRDFVYLAYIDDSDTKCKPRKWQVMSAVLIEDQNFKLVEAGVAVAQESLGLSPEQLEKFQEFHACELYGGYGFFEGIDQEVRFDAMRRLLGLLGMLDLHVVYGAVDLERLGNEIYASADPLDIGFRICARGIPSWLHRKHEQIVRETLGDEVANYTTENIFPVVLENTMRELTLIIMDDCDKKIRESLHATFRSIRPRRMPDSDAPFSSFHDDMYFGDSKYSFGIQIADACSYFIARHLEGDRETESFYEMISPHIVHSEIHPLIETGAVPTSVDFTEGLTACQKPAK
jgi:hypothetical protein